MLAMKKMVLLASDEREIRDLIKKSLECYDFEFIYATNEVTLISKAVQLKPDLIIIALFLTNLTKYSKARKGVSNKTTAPLLIVSLPQIITLRANSKIRIPNIKKESSILKLEEHTFKDKLRSEVAHLLQDIRSVPHPPKPVRKGKKILLADDEVDVRNGIREVLEMAGYQVTAVSNGEKLIKEAQKLEPDLIITDVIMPGLSGYRAVGRLKKIPKYLNIPVIFTTSRVLDKNLYETLKPKGPSYFMPKIFNMEELLDKLKIILNKTKIK